MGGFTLIEQSAWTAPVDGKRSVKIETNQSEVIILAANVKLKSI